MMKSFQKKKENQTLVFRTPDWFKGKNLSFKKPTNIRPISYQGTQHRG